MHTTTETESVSDPWPVGEVIRVDSHSGLYRVREVRCAGLCQIYTCTQEMTNTPIILKILREPFLREREISAQFTCETEVWVRLGKHPNILQVHRIDRIDTALGYPLVFLEYVSGHEQYGPTLSGWIQHKGLSLPLLLDFAAQICTGLLYAQAVSERDAQLPTPFVHGDLHPENILITSEQVVKISDCLQKASAALQGDLATERAEGEQHYPWIKQGMLSGALPYLAPELWEGKTPDRRTDIYAFGGLLYEMCAGVSSFFYDPGAADREIKYRQAHLVLHPSPVPHLPLALQRVIHTCLAKDREQRYPDFSVIREELARVYCEQTGKRLSWSTETEADWEAGDWLKKGNCLHSLGYHAEALSCYNQALQLNPNESDGYNNRGVLYYTLRQYEQAIADYTMAIQLHPSCARPYYNRGLVYQDLGQYKEAMADYTTTIRLHPAYDWAYFRRALLAERCGDYAQAMADYTAALRIHPRHIQAYRNRGNACMEQGEYTRAIADYTEVLRLDPTDANTYIKRGLAYHEQGEYTRAIADYTEVLRLQPSDSRAYYYRGRAYYHQRQYAQAIADYEKALSLNPYDVLITLHRRRAYQALEFQNSTSAN